MKEHQMGLKLDEIIKQTNKRFGEVNNLQV